MYFNRCEEKLFHWIAEVCLFETKEKKTKNTKVIKMRRFYENVKWRHFRPSAIKDRHHPCCCHGYFFLNVVIGLHGACSWAVVPKVWIWKSWRAAKHWCGGCDIHSINPKLFTVVYFIIENIWTKTWVKFYIKPMQTENIWSVFHISLLPLEPWRDKKKKICNSVPVD